jgi:uncharacterized membrane protein (DUF4010 family)
MENAADLAVALGIGLLLGAERERRKGSGPGRGAAGVRTFALVALLGGLAVRVGGDAVVAAALVFVGLAALAGYLKTGAEHPGITTEVALVVAFLLGALAQRDTELAAGIAVVVALLLLYRARLHTLVRDVLSEQELHDALLFAAAALVVLPLVPDEGIGPNEALNPFVVWRLVVLVMAVQGFGYIALRVVGPRFGLVLSGFIAGFVSATATVASMGSRAAKQPPLRRGAVAAAVASTVATVVLLAIVVGATSHDVLTEAALPLALAGLAALAYAALAASRAARGTSEVEQHGRAFDLRTPVILAATVTTVLVVAGALNEALGSRGAILSAAIAGFADAQSGAISAAALTAAGKLPADQGAIAVLAALSTNSISKGVVAAVLGGRRYAVAVATGLVLVVGAAWLGWGASAAAQPVAVVADSSPGSVSLPAALRGSTTSGHGDRCESPCATLPSRIALCGP